MAWPYGRVMDRRQMIAAGTVALATGASSASQASSSGGGVPDAAMSIAGLGLPVIEGGRLRNYVFVSLRLHLGAGKTAEQMKSKEPFLRDGLVKAAHRAPFSVPGDWTRLNERALSASLIAASAAIAGRGSVARVEVLAQNPRRRTGMPTA